MAPILEVEEPWNLELTGWGVLFAPGLDPKVHSALGLLLEHRRRQASRYKQHYYQEYFYRGETACEFLKRCGGRPGMMADPERVPYYILLVGDPESISYQFQSELDVNFAVGRICFDRIEDYAAYARSVVRAERRRDSGDNAKAREAVFFGTEHDPVTRMTALELVHRLAGAASESQVGFKVTEVRGGEAKKGMLRSLMGGPETPEFLFAACHGLSFNEDDDQRASLQGALVCQDWRGPDSGQGVGEDEWFAASDVPERASLLGLIAFLCADFSLGTPTPDRVDLTVAGKVRTIGAPASVSRLPQRLLSHQNGGALAVIGHVGQAWSTSFARASPEGEGFGAFLYGVRRLLKGHTVGWAMEYFNQSYAALAAQLSGLEELLVSREQVDTDLFAHLWLLRNGARNLMVFGDPAARLSGFGGRR